MLHCRKRTWLQRCAPSLHGHLVVRPGTVHRCAVGRPQCLFYAGPQGTTSLRWQLSNQELKTFLQVSESFCQAAGMVGKALTFRGGGTKVDFSVTHGASMDRLSICNTAWNFSPCAEPIGVHAPLFPPVVDAPAGSARTGGHRHGGGNGSRRSSPIRCSSHCTCRIRRMLQWTAPLPKLRVLRPQPNTACMRKAIALAATPHVPTRPPAPAAALHTPMVRCARPVKSAIRPCCCRPS